MSSETISLKRLREQIEEYSLKLKLARTGLQFYAESRHVNYHASKCCDCGNPNEVEDGKVAQKTLDLIESGYAAITETALDLTEQQLRAALEANETLSVQLSLARERLDACQKLKNSALDENNRIAKLLAQAVCKNP